MFPPWTLLISLILLVLLGCGSVKSSGQANATQAARQLGLLSEHIDATILADDPLAGPHYTLSLASNRTEKGLLTSSSLQRSEAEAIVAKQPEAYELIQVGKEHTYLCHTPLHRFPWQVAAEEAVDPTPPRTEEDTLSYDDARLIGEQALTLLGNDHIPGAPTPIEPKVDEEEEDAPCFGQTVDYWTYYFCPNHRLQQMHLEPMLLGGTPPVTKIVPTASYILGRVAPSGKRKNKEKKDGRLPMTSHIAIKKAFDHHAMFTNMHRLALDQPSNTSQTLAVPVPSTPSKEHMVASRGWSVTETWVDGTLCDVTRKPRETHVEYLCSEMNKTKVEIIKIGEMATCAYYVHIHWPPLCSLAPFQPRQKHDPTTLPSSDIACARVMEAGAVNATSLHASATRDLLLNRKKNPFVTTSEAPQKKKEEKKTTVEQEKVGQGAAALDSILKQLFASDGDKAGDDGEEKPAVRLAVVNTDVEGEEAEALRALLATLREKSGKKETAEDDEDDDNVPLIDLLKKAKRDEKEDATETPSRRAIMEHVRDGWQTVLDSLPPLKAEKTPKTKKKEERGDKDKKRQGAGK